MVFTNAWADMTPGVKEKRRESGSEVCLRKESSCLS